MSVKLGAMQSLGALCSPSPPSLLYVGTQELLPGSWVRERAHGSAQVCGPRHIIRVFLPGVLAASLILHWKTGVGLAQSRSPKPTYTSSLSAPSLNLQLIIPPLTRNPRNPPWTLIVCFLSDYPPSPQFWKTSSLDSHMFSTFKLESPLSVKGFFSIFCKSNLL